MSENIFRGYGVEIDLPRKSGIIDPKESVKDAFLKIRETLTRIGVASRKEKNLYQSCHILHKRGKYAILHFKELFALDGKPSTIEDDDIARRNRITQLLVEWNLCSTKVPFNEQHMSPLNYIKIVKHSEKLDWNLVTKYSVGTKKKA
ncbi:MAG TPA: translational repressor RegA [Methylomirabilota bacterium]|nr:translational repressor RegA [Methylomirabilota bacterium]